MKKQILTGVLLSVLAVSSAYAHKDKKDAKKPKTQWPSGFDSKKAF
ncbi:hypothetical protein E5K54_05675 [Helicobacter pylori]|nr:hypothetical protein E5K54_05675 [Helicobacter pylori]